jgi:hypothetical protein
VLLTSLSVRGGVHPWGYASALADRYGQSWDGYRDASIKVGSRHLWWSPAHVYSAIPCIEFMGRGASACDRRPLRAVLGRL